MAVPMAHPVHGMILDDVVATDITSFNDHAIIRSGSTMHPIKVSFADGKIHIGCTTMTVEAYEVLKRRIEAVIPDWKTWRE